MAKEAPASCTRKCATPTRACASSVRVPRRSARRSGGGAARGCGGGASRRPELYLTAAWRGGKAEAARAGLAATRRRAHLRLRQRQDVPPGAARARGLQWPAQLSAGVALAVCSVVKRRSSSRRPAAARAATPPPPRAACAACSGARSACSTGAWPGSSLRQALSRCGAGALSARADAQPAAQLRRARGRGAAAAQLGVPQVPGLLQLQLLPQEAGAGGDWHFVAPGQAHRLRLRCAAAAEPPGRAACAARHAGRGGGGGGCGCCVRRCPRRAAGSC